MRRARVGYRPEALADLQDVYNRVAERSQSHTVARGFVERIMARCRKIGEAPHGGRPRDDLEVGLRVVPFEHSAVIAYVVENNRVRVTNVFYGGRDYEALYRQGGEEPAGEE